MEEIGETLVLREDEIKLNGNNYMVHGKRFRTN